MTRPSIDKESQTGNRARVKACPNRCISFNKAHQLRPSTTALLTGEKVFKITNLSLRQSHCFLPLFTLLGPWASRNLPSVLQFLPWNDEITDILATMHNFTRYLGIQTQSPHSHVLSDLLIETSLQSYSFDYSHPIFPVPSPKSFPFCFLSEQKKYANF